MYDRTRPLFSASRSVKITRAKCPSTGKLRYRDPREATEALQQLLNKAAWADEQGGDHTITVRRKYSCRACNGWHLTSWESAGSPPHEATHPAATIATPGGVAGWGARAA